MERLDSRLPNLFHRSVLINDSLTMEFQFSKGLHQGDRLSHFLFIVVLEALHVDVQQDSSIDVFSDFSIGSSIMEISYLFYVDDTIFGVSN